MSLTSDRALRHLRAQVRPIVLTQGCAVAPGSNIPEAFDTVISDVAHQRRRTLDRDSDALLARIPDRDLARQISDHFGSIMAAFGDGGYFVGVCTGLELAALTYGRVASPSGTKGGAR